MTGWRLGYLAGPLEIIKAATTIQSHGTSNVCTFAQYGAIAALEGSQDCVETMRQAFAQRRQVMLARLNAIPGIAFGADDHIRLSYATDMTSIEKGMERLDKFIQDLQ